MYSLKSIILPIILASFAFAGQLSGAVYLYSLGTTYSGSSPEGPTPWLTASFEDVGVNQVSLTLTATNLTGNEFISGWYFNFDPSANVNDLTFTRTTPAPPSLVDTAVILGTDAFTAAGNLNFDIFVDLPTSNTERFMAGQTLAFLITSVDPLNAGMFNFSSTNGDLSAITVAHIQGIAPDNLSAWVKDGIAVPEPSTYILMASFIGLTMFLTARKRAVTEAQ